MKEFIAFLLLCLYVLGTIGGIGYLLYYGEYHVAIGVAGTGYLAWPKAKELFDFLRS